MKNALKYMRMAVPFLHLAAEELAELDENDTGTDDKAAAGIEYAAQIVEAISKGRDIPFPPAALMSKPV